MRQRNFVFAFASIAALLMAVPASGQLVGLPVFAVPSGGEEASTAFAAQFGRGLNANPVDNSAWAAYGVRSMRRFSVSLGLGYVAGEVKEATYGGQAAFHIFPNAEGYQISLQGGIGYQVVSEGEVSTGLGDVKTLRLPIGLALEAQPSENSRIWIMPRMDTAQIKNDVGESNHNLFGLSLGVAATSEGGVGVHAAFDFVDNETTPIGAAIGLHYILGR